MPTKKTNYFFRKNSIVLTKFPDIGHMAKIPSLFQNSLIWRIFCFSTPHYEYHHFIKAYFTEWICARRTPCPCTLSFPFEIPKTNLFLVISLCIELFVQWMCESNKTRIHWYAGVHQWKFFFFYRLNWCTTTNGDFCRLFKSHENMKWFKCREKQETEHPAIKNEMRVVPKFKKKTKKTRIMIEK